MKYGYISSDEHTDTNPVELLNTELQQSGVELDNLVIDEQPNRIHWEKRELKALVDTQLNAKDTLYCYDASNLARSTLQLLEIIDQLSKKGIKLAFIKYGIEFTPEDMVNTKEFLTMVQNIENDFVARRTTDALARRRAAGLPLGRPKGRRNKSRKLDKHKAEIKKYLALNISKASIAKLVGCHAQTLYNYIDDKGLEEEVAREKEQQLTRTSSTKSTEEGK